MDWTYTHAFSVKSKPNLKFSFISDHLPRKEKVILAIFNKTIIITKSITIISIIFKYKSSPFNKHSKFRFLTKMNNNTAIKLKYTRLYVERIS